MRKDWAATTIAAVSVVAFSLLSACTPSVPSVPPEDIYRHSSEYEGSSVSENIRVETNSDGTLDITGLGDSRLVSEFSLTEAQDGDVENMLVFPDTLGARNIQIGINEEVGHTNVAGLRFTEEATINIWEDGTVEVAREGVEVTDKDGTTWVSKEVKLKELEDKVATVVVKKR